jgi:hypothetical protein
MGDVTFSNLFPYIFTIVGLVVAWFLGRRKDSADISSNLAEASKTLSELYEKRIKALEDELEPLRPLPAQVQFLRAGIDVLLKQMKRMSIVPEWTPDTGVTIITRKNGR